MFIAVIRTVILYVFVILAIRLMGKRQISDMQPSELVVTMMISDIASLPMQNTAQPLLSGVVPVLVLVSLELTVSAVMLKSRLFRKLISGSPVVVIEDGRLLQRQLKRLRLTTDELCAQLRQQNVFSSQDVQYCIVETNGVLSVLEKPSKRVPNAEESGIVIPDNKMEAVVVSDGAWVESSLRLCGRTKQEINNILQKKQIKLNEIFLMTMDGN
ncbi:MAG: YetF domain-containing protein, partial [Ruminococcus sp.]